jgi:hypothetical protein
MSISPATEASPPVRFDEDIAASDHVRAEQARELLDAVTAMRGGWDVTAHYDASSLDAYLASLPALRDAVAARLGFPPPGTWRGGAPRIETIGEDDAALYHRATIAVSPRVHATGLYIVPRSTAPPLPLIVALHGGAGSPEIATFNGGANYHDMVRGCIDLGAAVWAPGMVFQAAGHPAEIRQVIDARARLAGTTIAALETMKIACSTEALLAARSDLDAGRVGMVGLSYGGFYTLAAGAFMPRVRVLVSSCYLGGRGDIVDQTEPYGWNDWRLPAGATARRTVERAASPYTRLGLGDRIELAECDGGHEFFGSAAWPFLRRHLMEKR